MFDASRMRIDELFAIDWSRVHPRPPGAPSGLESGIVANGYCTNVPPGYCCRSLSQKTVIAEFVDLPPGAVAAVWHDTLQAGCRGLVLETHTGNPRWRYENYQPLVGTRNVPVLSGGSYIQCPGVLAARGWIAILAGFCFRLNHSNKRRTVAKAVEPIWGYPDIVTVNGTNYTDGRRGDLAYRDAAGTLLNLTLLQRET